MDKTKMKPLDFQLLERVILKVISDNRNLFDKYGNPDQWKLANRIAIEIHMNDEKIRRGVK